MPIYVQLPNYSQGPLLLSLKTRLFATLTRIKGLPMLERLFRLSEHNTNVKTEVLAGITTFLTMSYIIFVNPDILSSTGMDRGAVFRSEEHSLNSSHVAISYAVFCLKN